MTALTAKTIKSMKPGAARREIPDDDMRGLYHVIQKSGSKGWAYRFSLNGKTHKLTLGPYPELGLADARRKAASAAAMVAEGNDPAAAKRAASAARKPVSAADPEAFETVARRFIEKHVATLRPNSRYQYTRIIEKLAIPHFKGKRIADIKRADVRAFLETVNGDTLPNRVHAMLSKLFAWAINRDLVEVNPCTGIEKAKETSRDRVLSDDELVRVWRASEPLGDYGRVVRLLILTGTRRSEVADLVWSEIVGDLWNLPRERSKNKVALSLPLADAALAILGERGEGRIFKTISFADQKRQLDAAADLSTPFILHDLRRSMASGLQAIDVAPHVIERILNHVVKGVQGTYQRHPYAKEMREALDRWARHLERLLGGDGASNVVTLRSA